LTVDDYLTPGEELRFSSTAKVRYGSKHYQVYVTNKRLIMYARRGTFLKGDDVVSLPLDEMHGIKYKESGLLMREGILEFQGKTLVQLSGPPKDTKALYQQIIQFL
jgi:hypothetical protein